MNVGRLLQANRGGGEAGVGSGVGCGGAVASLGLLLNTIKVYLNKLSFKKNKHFVLPRWYFLASSRKILREKKEERGKEGMEKEKERKWDDNVPDTQ